MGQCCVKPDSVNPPPEKSSSLAVSDMDLLARKRSRSLTHTEIEEIIMKSISRAVQYFCNSLKSLVDSADVPYENQMLQHIYQKELVLTLDYYKSLFREKSQGQDVPFKDIKESEEKLKSACLKNSKYFSYSNTYNSYLLCSGVSSKLIDAYLTGSNGNSEKILSTYTSEAKGPFTDICGIHLRQLISVLDSEGVDRMLKLRRKQIQKESEVLYLERKDLKDDSDLLFVNFATFGRNDSLVSEESRQARGTVIDFIDGIPDLSASETGEEDIFDATVLLKESKVIKTISTNDSEIVGSRFQEEDDYIRQPRKTKYVNDVEHMEETQIYPPHYQTEHRHAVATPTPPESNYGTNQSEERDQVPELPGNKTEESFEIHKPQIQRAATYAAHSRR